MAKEGGEITAPLFLINVINNHSLNKLLEEKGFKLTHPALYSYEIPMLLLLPTSDRNDICFDIFSGLGKTGIVVFANDRSYIGVENSEIYATQSKARFIKLFINKYKNNFLNTITKEG
jgi:DNA modification methylase